MSEYMSSATALQSVRMLLQLYFLSVFLPSITQARAGQRLSQLGLSQPVTKHA